MIFKLVCTGNLSTNRGRKRGGSGAKINARFVLIPRLPESIGLLPAVNMASISTRFAVKLGAIERRCKTPFIGCGGMVMKS